MTIQLSAATALAGTLIATCFVSGSAQATFMPVVKSDATPDLVTLVKHGGGHHGGGHHGGGHHGGGHHGGGHHAHHGGGGKHPHSGGGKRYYGGGGKHHAYRGGGYGHYYRHKHYGHYRGYYGWYSRPYFGYGYYGGECGWLYRRAIATGSPYWWDRYYDCMGYY